MSRGTLCERDLFKHSMLLPVLHFKPFHAATLLSIFTFINKEGSVRF